MLSDWLYASVLWLYQILLVAQVGKGFSHRKLLGMIQFLGNQNLYLGKSLLQRISTMSQNAVTCHLSLGALPPPPRSSYSLLLHLFFCKIQQMSVFQPTEQDRAGHINSFQKLPPHRRSQRREGEHKLIAVVQGYLNSTMPQERIHSYQCLQ